jgi:hypothetical protein
MCGKQNISGTSGHKTTNTLDEIDKTFACNQRSVRSSAFVYTFEQTETGTPGIGGISREVKKIVHQHGYTSRNEAGKIR